MSENIIEIIMDLNENIPDKLGMNYEYHTNGFYDEITLGGHQLYCSENDTTEEIEALGGFKKFLIYKTESLANKIYRIYNLNTLLKAR